MRTIGVSLLAFFFVLLVTHVAFLYWDANQTIFQYENVSLVGTNATIQQRFASNQNNRLVPLGAVKGVNDVDSISFYYEIKMEKLHTLEVSIEDITFIKTQSEFLDTYGLVITNHEITYVDQIAVVVVTVSLRMPQTEAELVMMQNSSLTFRVEFNQKPTN